ncbi:hypothetical protein HAX54_036267, partial [Datura stramonium]|nr:hypothetical protein [Datura stramonium]
MEGNGGGAGGRRWICGVFLSVKKNEKKREIGWMERMRGWCGDGVSPVAFGRQWWTKVRVSAGDGKWRAGRIWRLWFSGWRRWRVLISGSWWRSCCWWVRCGSDEGEKE